MSLKLTAQHATFVLPSFVSVISFLQAAMPQAGAWSISFLKGIATDAAMLADFCQHLADVVTSLTNPTPETFHAALKAKVSEMEKVQVTGPILDLLKALLAQYLNNPAQLLALVQWILTMFGVNIPIPPIPAA